MGARMRNIFNRPIPIGFFALVLILATVGYVISFVRQGQHFSEMDAFMAQGDRFTGQDGRDMAERIDLLEERVMLLEAKE